MTPFHVLLTKGQAKWSWFVIDSERANESGYACEAFGTAADVRDAAEAACVAIDQLEKENAK